MFVYLQINAISLNRFFNLFLFLILNIWFSTVLSIWLWAVTAIYITDLLFQQSFGVRWFCMQLNMCQTGGIKARRLSNLLSKFNCLQSVLNKAMFQYGKNCKYIFNYEIFPNLLQMTVSLPKMLSKHYSC